MPYNDNDIFGYLDDKSEKTSVPSITSDVPQSGEKAPTPPAAGSAPQPQMPSAPQIPPPPVIPPIQMTSAQSVLNPSAGKPASPPPAPSAQPPVFTQPVQSQPLAQPQPPAQSPYQANPAQPPYQPNPPLPSGQQSFAQPTPTQPGSTPPLTQSSAYSQQRPAQPLAQSQPQGNQAQPSSFPGAANPYRPTAVPGQPNQPNQPTGFTVNQGSAVNPQTSGKETPFNPDFSLPSNPAQQFGDPFSAASGAPPVKGNPFSAPGQNPSFGGTVPQGSAQPQTSNEVRELLKQHVPAGSQPTPFAGSGSPGSAYPNQFSQPGYQPSPSYSPRPSVPPSLPEEKGSWNGGKKKKAAIAVVLVAIITVGAVFGYKYVSGRIAGDDNPPQAQGNVEEDITAADIPETDLNAAVTDPTDQDTVKTVYSPASPDGVLTTTEVYNKVLPSVVSITCVFDSRGLNFQGFSYGGEVMGTGTGIIMTDDGYIMTNHHVVNGAKSIQITTHDGSQYDADVVGMDERSDIAVIKVAASGLSAAEYGDSSKVQVGEKAIVIGNPLSMQFAGTLTQGVISSTERQLTDTDSNGYTFIATLIQTDAAVNPGNSGGPLINDKGQIVGVVTSKIADTDIEGIGFAVPSNIAQSIAEELMQNGTVQSRPILGITVNTFSSEYVRNYNESNKTKIESGELAPLEEGIFVVDIIPNSSAADAGMQVGDKILSFNGVNISSSEELNFEKEKYKIGDSVTVGIERNGQTLELSMTLKGSNVN